MAMSSNIESLLDGVNERDAKSALEEICSRLRRENSKYDWVGIYVLMGDHLELYAFSGEETEHKKIKLGDGLCSLAIVKNETVNVSNVKEDPKYLACFPSTKSELVVPIRHAGKAIGEIDIDSDTPAAFGRSDEMNMERLAELLSKMVSVISQS